MDSYGLFWTGSRDAPEAAGTALVFQGARRPSRKHAPRRARPGAPGAATGTRALQGAPGPLPVAHGEAPLHRRDRHYSSDRETGRALPDDGDDGRRGDYLAELLAKDPQLLLWGSRRSTTDEILRRSSSRGRRLTGLNVAEDVPLRTTPVMLRGGRSREPLSRQGLTWDEFLDELEQIERLGPHSAPGSAPGSPAASPAPAGRACRSHTRTPCRTLPAAAGVAAQRHQHRLRPRAVCPRTRTST